MKLIAFIILNLLLTSVLVNAAHAQEDKRKVESTTMPYMAANADRTILFITLFHRSIYPIGLGVTHLANEPLEID